MINGLYWWYESIKQKKNKNDIDYSSKKRMKWKKLENNSPFVFYSKNNIYIPINMWTISRILHISCKNYLFIWFYVIYIIFGIFVILCMWICFNFCVFITYMNIMMYNIYIIVNKKWYVYIIYIFIDKFNFLLPYIYKK